MRLYYAIELKSPVIVSENSSTGNGHNSLDYIPGSALLGALASNHYQSLDSNTSWTLFHSGHVSFGNAYICHQQGAHYTNCLPMPLAWFAEKSATEELTDKDGKLNHNAVYDRSQPASSKQDSVQLQQLRSGYISSHGHRISVNKQVHTKTALDADSGIVKKGQLFHYSSLQPDQTFVGYIEVNDADTRDTLTTLLPTVTHIGRSRSAEYGMVEVRVLSDAGTQQHQTNKKQLCLWLTSDAELLDEHGQPTLSPHGDVIGLTGASLNLQRSHIRSLNTNKFNRTRGGFDGQQMLIQKGSVLVYELEQPLSPKDVNALQHQGIGINRQQGLGQIEINPPWFEQFNSSWFSAVSFTQSQVVANVADSPLLQWLDAKVRRQQTQQQSQQAAFNLMSQLLTFYTNGRQYANIPDSYSAGPTKSQWRRLFNTLRAEQRQQWQAIAFDGDSAICKATNDPLGWGLSWSKQNKSTDFAQQAQALLSELSYQQVIPLLEEICRFDLSTRVGLSAAKKRIEQKQLSTEQHSVKEDV